MQDLAIWQDFVHQEVGVPLLQYAAECMRMWANERSDANIELFLDLGINGAGGRYCWYRIVGSVELIGELDLLAWRLYVLGFCHDRGS